MTDRQRRYLELAGGPAVVEEDPEGWILVEYRPSIEVDAARAEVEREVGVLVELADEVIWVDPLGREHFGPHEAGHDRFGLSE